MASCVICLGIFSTDTWMCILLLLGDVFCKRPSGPDGWPLLSPISLPVFSLVFQSVITRTVLKSPTITVVCLFLFPVLPGLGSHSLQLGCLVYIRAESPSSGWIDLVCNVVFWLVIFFALMSTLPDDYIARHTCFGLIVFMIYFFPSFYFQSALIIVFEVSYR